MLSKLEHPNIVKYYDWCITRQEIDNKPTAEMLIYMEYMNQGSIR